MKTVLSIWVWVIYCSVSLFYFASFGLIEPMYSKLIYLSASLFVTVFSIIQILTNPTGYTVGFVVLCLSAIGLNFLFILLYHLFGIDNYKLKFCTFIGIEFITALFILISGTKRGIFNDK